MTTDVARKIFAAAGSDFDKLKAASDYPGFKPVPLHAKASALHRKQRSSTPQRTMC